MREGRLARRRATRSGLGLTLLLVAIVSAGCAPLDIPDPGTAEAIAQAGFPVGTYAKEFTDPVMGRVRLAWTFDENGDWVEVPFGLDGQQVGFPARGTYRIEGDALAIDVAVPPEWGTSHHTWRVEGDRLVTDYVSSDFPEDADWFGMLDQQPWVPFG